MKYIDILLDIFVENREKYIPQFMPIDLTSHYKNELGELSLDSLYIATKYSDIEILLARYKYSSEREYVDIFVDLLSKLVDKYKLSYEENPIFVPVPMHWSRYFLRGFDHTKYLSKQLSKRVGIPYQKVLLAKWSRHQSHLSRQKRLENKRNSFRMNNHDISDGVILLIDDVISSGSTANECAKVLKQAGAKKVIGIFLASNF